MSDMASRREADWIDVSVPIRSGMAGWPGDPAVEVTRLADIDAGSTYNLSWVRMSAHSGTHIDAPLHMLAGGVSMDDMPLDAVIGPARVIDIPGTSAIAAEDLHGHKIEPGDRILLKTSASQRCSDAAPFVEDCAGLTLTGARYMVEQGVRVIGIDGLSIGGCGSECVDVHRLLMQAGVWIMERLDLSKVPPGRYDLICLPLKIAGAEGAPARAVLRRIEPV